MQGPTSLSDLLRCQDADAKLYILGVKDTYFKSILGKLRLEQACKLMLKQGKCNKTTLFNCLKYSGVSQQTQYTNFPEEEISANDVIDEAAARGMIGGSLVGRKLTEEDCNSFKDSFTTSTPRTDTERNMFTCIMKPYLKHTLTPPTTGVKATRGFSWLRANQLCPLNQRTPGERFNRLLTSVVYEKTASTIPIEIQPVPFLRIGKAVVNNLVGAKPASTEPTAASLKNWSKKEYVPEQADEQTKGIGVLTDELLRPIDKKMEYFKTIQQYLKIHVAKDGGDSMFLFDTIACEYAAKLVNMDGDQSNEDSVGKYGQYAVSLHILTQMVKYLESMSAHGPSPDVFASTIIPELQNRMNIITKEQTSSKEKAKLIFEANSY